MLTTNHIEKIRDYVSGYKSVVAVYVFGSVATGKDRRGSDIDLAVMVEGDFSGMTRVEMETALSNLLHSMFKFQALFLYVFWEIDGLRLKVLRTHVLSVLCHAVQAARPLPLNLVPALLKNPVNDQQTQKPGGSA